MILAFIIWSLCALIFVWIGISSGKSKEPTGFFTFRKPPEVSDVKGFNNAVRKIWLATAVVFEMLGLPFLVLQQNSAGAMLVVVGTLVLIIGLIVAYLRVEAKYRR